MHEQHFPLPIAARTDIRALGAFLQIFVDGQTEVLLVGSQEKWQQLFESIGDMAYGRFNAQLFLPFRRTLADAGLKAVPRLPGSFQSSREWGNLDETHQQRWFTSRILSVDGTTLGTLAVGSHHDHSRFRLPRTPEVIALNARTAKDVVNELAAQRPRFAEAQEFREWYKDHLLAETEKSAAIDPNQAEVRHAGSKQ